MVLPTARHSGVAMGEDDTTILSEITFVEKKRSSDAFHETPQRQKRLRLDDNDEQGDTPPTDTSGETAQNPAEYDENILVSEIESPPLQDDEEAQEDDIDWDKLAQSEPARTDIPIFLAALARKEAANERFAAAFDEIHSSLLTCVEALLQAIADVHNVQRDRMEAMEADIKHNLVCNDAARAQMQERLQESANAAQGLFAKLLQRVTEPIQMATARMQQAMASDENGGGESANK